MPCDYLLVNLLDSVTILPWSQGSHNNNIRLRLYLQEPPCHISDESRNLMHRNMDTECLDLSEGFIGFSLSIPTQKTAFAVKAGEAEFGDGVSVVVVCGFGSGAPKMQTRRGSRPWRVRSVQPMMPPQIHRERNGMEGVTDQTNLSGNSSLQQKLNAFHNDYTFSNVIVLLTHSLIHQRSSCPYPQSIIRQKNNTTIFQQWLARTSQRSPGRRTTTVATNQRPLHGQRWAS